MSERLWAPWRMAYIKENADNPKIKSDGIDNFIIEADQSENDRENFVVDRSEYSIVLLNKFPYNNGHILVAPRREVANLHDLSPEELLDLQLQIRRMVEALGAFMRPDGFNIGLNLGKAAGAGLPQHLHWHIVPRWNGDTNYMSVCTEMRVIVQSLDELWQLLRKQMDLPIE